MMTLLSVASLVLVSVTALMLAPLQHSVHDCSRWLAEENQIVAYSESSEYDPAAHTYVLEGGELEVNELVKEEDKDACTRALHSNIAKKNTERRRLGRFDGVHKKRRRLMITGVSEKPKPDTTNPVGAARRRMH